MILGIGVDIVHVSRIQKSMDRKTEALARRILTATELEKFRSTPHPAAYLAKRFAAKEAASKAMGTGIGKISWQDLEIDNNSQGRPALICRGYARTRLDEIGVENVDISLADESDLAIAFVVLSN